MGTARKGPLSHSDDRVQIGVTESLIGHIGNSRLLVGLDARLWPLLEGLDLWGVSSRELVARSRQVQVEAIVMPRILSEADKNPAPPRPLPDRVRDTCKAATDTLVTNYNATKTVAPLDVVDAAIVERNALAIVREPGLAVEVRTIVGECQVPSWVADRARYEELMSKRSSRAGDFRAKSCGCLDRTDAAEKKREFAARKGIP